MWYYCWVVLNKIVHTFIIAIFQSFLLYIKFKFIGWQVCNYFHLLSMLSKLLVQSGSKYWAKPEFYICVLFFLTFSSGVGEGYGAHSSTYSG